MNKKVFDAELYVIGKTLYIALGNKPTCRGRASQETTGSSTRIDIWRDSRVVIAQVYHTAPGPCPWLATRIITRAQQLTE